jgi:hypothetical protein
MLAVYRQIRTYCYGLMCVVLRNRILKGKEVDEVGVHVEWMREAGWRIVETLRRDLLRPTGYQQWKVARDPSTPWIRWEYVVVAERAGGF